MAYDAQKAHEYYVKYRKKGLKKGRKKGRKATKGTQTSILGLHTSGMNDAGKMQAALVKDQLKKEMNAALAKETDPIKKEQIRQQYQQKALEAYQKIKADPQYAAQKKASTKAAGSKGSKSSGSKGSSSEGKSSGSSGSSSSSVTQAQLKQAEEQAQALIDSVMAKLESMTPDQKSAMKLQVQEAVSQLESIYDNILKAKKKG